VTIVAAPKISIVIPTYNRKRDLLECLDSVQKLNYPSYETIVVDNGSTDQTAEAVRRHFPNVKLIVSDVNLGVTGGRNLGARNSNGEYIFFLDHDTVVDGNALSELVTVIENDYEIGIAGPVIYYYEQPKRIWAAGTSINLLTGKISFNKAGEVDAGLLNQIIEVQVLPTAFLVKREVVAKIGLFDDVYFAVYEDTDFCFRARGAGYKVVCVPTAKAWHKVPLDPREQVIGVLRRAYYVARNRIIFMRKHLKPLNFVFFFLVFVPVYALYYTFQSVKFGKLNFALNYWRGVWKGFCSLF
jgi:GT2 family glycosyltransferase